MRNPALPLTDGDTHHFLLYLWPFSASIINQVLPRRRRFHSRFGQFPPPRRSRWKWICPLGAWSATYLESAPYRPPNRKESGQIPRFDLFQRNFSSVSAFLANKDRFTCSETGTHHQAGLLVARSKLYVEDMSFWSGRRRSS